MKLCVHFTTSCTVTAQELTQWLLFRVPCKYVSSWTLYEIHLGSSVDLCKPASARRGDMPASCRVPAGQQASV